MSTPLTPLFKVRPTSPLYLEHTLPEVGGSVGKEPTVAPPVTETPRTGKHRDNAQLGQFALPRD